MTLDKFTDPESSGIKGRVSIPAKRDFRFTVLASLTQPQKTLGTCTLAPESAWRSRHAGFPSLIRGVSPCLGSKLRHSAVVMLMRP
jgi:hypothetical protein